MTAPWDSAREARDAIENCDHSWGVYDEDGRNMSGKPSACADCLTALLDRARADVVAALTAPNDCGHRRVTCQSTRKCDVCSAIAAEREACADIVLEAGVVEEDATLIALAAALRARCPS